MNNSAAIALTVLAVLLGVLNIAAGVPKVMQMQQELEFLSAIGFSGTGVLLLGVIQVAGGCLILINKCRLYGAVLAGIALGISTIAVFAAGDMAFGSVSLLPLLLTGVMGFFAKSERYKPAGG